MSDNSFYFRDKFYCTYEEFEKAVEEYQSANATGKDIHEMFEEIAKNLSLNLNIYEIKLTNRELRQIGEKIFLLSIKLLGKDLFYKSKNI